MNIYEFAKLGTSEKETMLKKQGTFVEEYEEKEKRVLVYQFPDFFVEVETMKAGVSITPFKHK